MNHEKLLVDTSAWIASFQRVGSKDLKEFLKEAVSSGAASTTPIVILELLQGCRNEQERDTLRLRLESLDVLPVTQETWERAYDLGFSLPRRGLTIPTVDLVIASIALENNYTVLHQDRHFDLIARHSPLRTHSF